MSAAGRPQAPGRIVIVGTPIGNLGDLSPRAAASLASADVIFCEDTRRTRALLSAAAIPAPRLVASHQHNEEGSAARAVAAAAGGATVAVVSDAGMPGISDPGEALVRAAAAAGIPVQVVPGPTAFVAAVVASGLPSARFCFEGFLPRRGGERRARLRRLAAETRTTVLYEAPHRVARTLADLAEACGPERPVAIGRELTKLHEELWRGTLAEAAGRAAAVEPRGEWVLVVGGAPAEPAAGPAEADIAAALRARLEAGAGRREAVVAVAAELDVPKREVYRVSVGMDRAP